MSNTLHVEVSGSDQALDAVQAVLEQAADDARTALTEAGIEGTVTFHGDGMLHVL